MDGIKDYHSTVLPDIKVNGMVLTAPSKVQIDRNNFDIPLRSILRSFMDQRNECNPYHQLLRSPRGIFFFVTIRCLIHQNSLLPAPYSFISFFVYVLMIVATSSKIIFFIGKLYSIIHDWIQKFTRELNGVIARTTSHGMDPVTVPWSLTEIQGGSLNADICVTTYYPL